MKSGGGYVESEIDDLFKDTNTHTHIYIYIYNREISL